MHDVHVDRIPSIQIVQQMQDMTTATEGKKMLEILQYACSLMLCCKGYVQSRIIMGAYIVFLIPVYHHYHGCY